MIKPMPHIKVKYTFAVHTDFKNKFINNHVLLEAVLTRTLVIYSNFNALAYYTYKTLHTYTARYLYHMAQISCFLYLER